MTNILIIGGGYAGLRTASGLRGAADVTIVDRNDYFNHKAAALRGGAVAGWEDKTVIPHAAINVGAAFIQGDVVGIDMDERHATLADGRMQTFDYIVLATGSSTSLPSDALGVTVEKAKTTLRDYQKKVAPIRSAIIIGDGPVGVEWAGELRDIRPDMTIDIVSGSSAPMASVGSAKFGKRVEKLLGDEKIGYHPNTRVTRHTETTVTFEDGRTMSAELVISAVGQTPNTGWLSPIAPHWLDDRGQIKVGDDFKIIGEDRAFAIGDCSDIAEPKMLKMADGQGEALAANIRRLIAGESTQPHERFEKKLTILPFGSKNGLALLPIGIEGKVVWAPLGRLLVSKRKGTQLLANMFPSVWES